MILTSNKSINELNLKLKDLKSRLKNCLFAEIQKPDDILIQALITKNLADYQITIDSKLIDFISKRITRSFTKIREFICTNDEITLKPLPAYTSTKAFIKKERKRDKAYKSLALYRIIIENGVYKSKNPNLSLSINESMNPKSSTVLLLAADGGDGFQWGEPSSKDPWG